MIRSVPLLTARWSHVLLAAWEAPDDVLRPHLPPGVELDRRNGKSYVNVVGLLFHRIRTAGFLPVAPGFAQINLRILARHEDRPGLVFVGMLAPNHLVNAAARMAFGQPYRTAPVALEIHSEGDGIRAEYRLGRGAGSGERITATGSPPTGVPGPGTLEHFCLERYWSFGPLRRGRLLRFHVRHPSWALRTVWRWAVELDSAALWGSPWGFLGAEAPAMVAFAMGSRVRMDAPDSTSAPAARAGVTDRSRRRPPPHAAHPE